MRLKRYRINLTEEQDREHSSTTIAQGLGAQLNYNRSMTYVRHTRSRTRSTAQLQSLNDYAQRTRKTRIAENTEIAFYAAELADYDDFASDNMPIVPMRPKD